MPSPLSIRWRAPPRINSSSRNPSTLHAPERHPVNRRRFVTLTAVGLLAAVSTACSTGSGPIGTNSGVKLEYWHINTEAFGATAVDELVKDFNDSHPNISVEAKYHDGYGDLVTALQSGLAAGTVPDVAQIGYSRNQYIVENFPYVSMTDLGVDTSGYADNILSLGNIDGTQVAMPYGLSVLQVYYNGDLLRRTGLDPQAPPATWDEWIAAADQMKSVAGLPLINFQQFAGDNFIAQAMIGSNGGEVLSCVSPGRPPRPSTAPRASKRSA